jgi:aryl-alcohol dehydrogenase-like predicted oxidoreductase
MKEKRNFLGLVSEQSLYNLSARLIELEVIPACRDFGLGLIPWSPLAGGLLGGVLSQEAAGRRSTERLQQNIQKFRPQLESYERLCVELNEAPANIALAWLLNNSVVTAPIIGPRTISQLDESLKALEIKLSADTLSKLNEIWPGPGGSAPEAYAW